MEQLPAPRASGWSLWIGIALLVLGVAVNVIAGAQHAAFLRRLERGEAYRPAKWSLAIAIAAALAVLGVGTVVYLLLLVP
jgi:putative membrane protein